MRGIFGDDAACHGSPPQLASSPRPTAPAPCRTWRRLSSRSPSAPLICVSCPVLRAVYGRAQGRRYRLDDEHIIGGAAGVYQKRSFLETARSSQIGVFRSQATL